MRNDRRSITELNDRINRNTKTSLTAWEKNNVKTMWSELNGRKWPDSYNGCPACWREAIEQIAKSIKSGNINESKEVKDKSLPILEKGTHTLNFPKAELTREELEKMKLVDLRLLYKDIKATSVKSFVAKIFEDGK